MRKQIIKDNAKKKSVNISVKQTIFYEQYTIIQVCEREVSVISETKIFLCEHYMINEREQQVVFESDSQFAFYGRYTALRTGQKQTFLQQETLNFRFHRRYKVTKVWTESRWK